VIIEQKQEIAFST